MKKVYYIILSLSLIALSSCNDFLDIKPKGVLIPEFYEDYQRLLNHQNTMSIDNTYTNYITDDILLGDESVPYGQLIQAQEYMQNLYTFQHGDILSKGMTDYLWENAYKRIYTFNVVINNVGGCPDGTQKEKDELLATAKLNRAYEYLILVNMYANHYSPTTAGTDLGVPIILSEDISKNYKRHSVEEVYTQILQDLNDAQKSIPEKASSKFFPDQKSLNALFAKVYLYMGNWEKAKEYAAKIVTGTPQLINLTDYIIDPKANGSGRVYNQVLGKKYPDIREDNPESLLAKNGSVIGLSRNIYLSQDFLDTFKKDLPENATDQRRALFTIDNEFKLYNNISKFPGKTMWVAYCEFNGGLNYSETMLILAECEARLSLKGGNGAAASMEAAYKLLDELRDYRILDNQPLPRKDAQAALQTVLEERRRELSFRGSTRLIDLKRLNREEAFKKDIVHSAGSQTWTLPANDPRYILPLPPKVTGENPSIPQLER